MKELTLTEILSRKHIQDTGRDLWQSYFDNDNLGELSDGVEDEIGKEISVLLWPEMDIPEELGEFPSEVIDIINCLVEENLDIDELEREARENTDDCRETEEARKGEY